MWVTIWRNSVKKYNSISTFFFRCNASIFSNNNHEKYNLADFVECLLPLSSRSPEVFVSGESAMNVSQNDLFGGTFLQIQQSCNWIPKQMLIMSLKMTSFANTAESNQLFSLLYLFIIFSIEVQPCITTHYPYVKSCRTCKKTWNLSTATAVCGSKTIQIEFLTWNFCPKYCQFPKI